MSSDRGPTMHRGLARGGEPQGDWAQPTAPSARKLPGAPRERKPALAALAVVLILGGALAVGYLMLQNAKRAETIPPGTLLTSNMAVRTNQLTNGKAVMGLALKDGQLPSGLAVGDHINIYEGSDATEGCPGPPGSRWFCDPG